MDLRTVSPKRDENNTFPSKACPYYSLRAVDLPSSGGDARSELDARLARAKALRGETERENAAGDDRLVGVHGDRLGHHRQRALRRRVGRTASECAVVGGERAVLGRVGGDAVGGVERDGRRYDVGNERCVAREGGPAETGADAPERRLGE